MVVEKSLNRSIRRRLGLAVGVAALSLLSTSSMAAVVYSGAVNIPIPNNIDGIYFNVVTGDASPAPPAGWDLNPYSAVAGQLNLWGESTTTWFSTGDINGSYLLANGTSIDPTAVASFFRPGGNIVIPVTVNSSDNFLGFRFPNESAGGQLQAGWLQLQVGATAGTRAIIAYAYEDTGQPIQVGTTPVTLQNYTVD